MSIYRIQHLYKKPFIRIVIHIFLLEVSLHKTTTTTTTATTMTFEISSLLLFYGEREMNTTAFIFSLFVARHTGRTFTAKAALAVNFLKTKKCCNLTGCRLYT